MLVSSSLSHRLPLFFFHLASLTLLHVHAVRTAYVNSYDETIILVRFTHVNKYAHDASERKKKIDINHFGCDDGAAMPMRHSAACDLYLSFLKP